MDQESSEATQVQGKTYRSEFKGDWGSMLNTPKIQTVTETLAMPDGVKLFLRSWKTAGRDILLILHGLGAHGGWFIDMGNELAARGLSVYAVDHRGFGRSEGYPGHIDRYQSYLEDIATVVNEIRRRHTPSEGGDSPRLYVLGHSMGGIFAAHFAVQHGDLLSGVIFLNPWVQDTSKVPLGTQLAILAGGLLKSRQARQLAGGPEVMTTNPEAITMLAEDTYWQRAQTATFMLQILQMRTAILKQASRITVPALVLQAEEDKAVVPDATRKLYETLASSDKTWRSYPGYAHDTELEHDRALLDNDIVGWIKAHAD